MLKEPPAAGAHGSQAGIKNPRPLPALFFILEILELLCYNDENIA